jgi:GH25 family lysozyme M1 (1,4-beta-N-acetylmuramidase)
MDFAYRVDMWQYTNQGTVPGITGNVDLNLWFPES